MKRSQIIHNYSELCDQYNLLLGENVFQDKKSIFNVLGQNFLDLLSQKEQNKSLLLELWKMEMFFKNLVEIKINNEMLFNKFKQKLRKINSTKNNYFDLLVGERHEVQICAALLRKKNLIDSPEPPDFYIKDIDLSIECSTVRVNELERNMNLLYLKQKIRSKLNKKIFKNGIRYKTLNNLVLTIDYTNLYNRFLRSSSNQIFPSKSTLSDIPDFFLNSVSNLHSILFFVYMYNENLKRFEHNYIRHDSTNIPEEINEFLNNLWPISKHSIGKHFVPLHNS